MPSKPLAVVDIGSNSARMIVVHLTPGGHLEVLVDARARLKLMRDVGRGRALPEEAIRRTVATMAGFLTIAARERASRVIAVATAAVREAANRDEITGRLRQETGVDVTVLGGDEEARLAFMGAVHGLPVDSGILLDVGGGSLELARFRDRRQVATWTLPLGALRLSDRILVSNPPRTAELEALDGHVRERLREAGIPSLGPGEQLVGTGGTIRSVAKIDRARGSHAIRRLHGYAIRRADVAEIARRVAALPTARRASVRGLSADRSDSIAGGALTVATVLDHLGARELLVSGQGLREGLAYERLSRVLPSSRDVRRQAVAALAARFRSWSEARAAVRRELVAVLTEALEPSMPAEVREALEHAATLADVGRTVDFYNRWQHSAAIIMGSDLTGFSHRGIELAAAIAARVDGDAPAPRRGSFIAKEDREPIARAAVVLMLADELESRLPRTAGLDVVRRDRRGTIVLTVPTSLPLERGGELSRRFRRAFGRTLEMDAPRGARESAMLELK